MNQTQKNRIMVRIFQMVAGLFILASTAVASGEVLTVISPTAPLPYVVAADGKVHQDAAADLCDYLGRVTGRKIKPGQDVPNATVTIHIGPDAFVLEHAPEVKELFADGFMLKHVTVQGKHHIILSGIRWLSSRWAVEEFLKRFCGVRWLFPGDAKYGEIVPSRPTITVDSELDQRYEPDYLNRSNCQMYYFDKTRTYLRLRAFGSGPFGNHAFQHIFDRDDFKAHPEWFALFTVPDSDISRFPLAEKVAARGKRQRWHWDYGNGWQICMSNPGTVQHAVEYARDYFAKNPESPVVSMGHNDGNGWCECPKCIKFANSVDPPYTISERYWYWVNQVAKELAKTHPDKLITTIAYGTPATPPRFPLEKNVSVTVTVYLKGHLDLTRRWKKKCDSVNLYSYAYGWFFVGFRHYPHAMHDFLKWGHDELRAVSHVSEVYGNWSFDGPKYHYMQALMWDVNADPDKIMQDYCYDWFGAAAGPMKVFWDRLEQVYERCGHPRRLLFYQWLGWNENHDEFDNYTLDDVTLLDKSIAEAERKADTEADRFRVARVADAWKYYRTFLLGKLKYTDREDSVLAEAARSLGRALELAKGLAELQSQRLSFGKQLRAYSHINPQIARENYLSIFSKVSIFSDMRTLLDDLCEQTTSHLIKAKGKAAAVAFWQKIKRDDPLYQSAKTQLYMIEHQARANSLVNGDFETGNLSGWKVAGPTNVTAGTSRNGRHAAQAKGTLSQTVPLKPGERYRLTIWGKCTTKPDPNAILFSTNVSFRGGGKSRSLEPTYRRLRTVRPTDGWNDLRTTFTVPPAADTAVISVTASGSSILLDDLTLKKINDGPQSSRD